MDCSTPCRRKRPIYTLLHKLRLFRAVQILPIGRVNKKEHLDPRDYGLSKNKFRHLKVLDLLDENGVKSLNLLKDDLKLTSLPYLSHSRLERVIQCMNSANIRML